MQFCLEAFPQTWKRKGKKQQQQQQQQQQGKHLLALLDMATAIPTAQGTATAIRTTCWAYYTSLEDHDMQVFRGNQYQCYMSCR